MGFDESGRKLKRVEESKCELVRVEENGREMMIASYFVVIISAFQEANVGM